MRIRANSIHHPTVKKLEKLFTYLREELKLELSFYSDRIFVNDLERVEELDWELCDQKDEHFISEMPCNDYKLCQNIDSVPTVSGMTPREIPAYKKP